MGCYNLNKEVFHFEIEVAVSVSFHITLIIWNVCPSIGSMKKKHNIFFLRKKGQWKKLKLNEGQTVWTKSLTAAKCIYCSVVKPIRHMWRMAFLMWRIIFSIFQKFKKFFFHILIHTFVVKKNLGETNKSWPRMYFMSSKICFQLILS